MALLISTAVTFPPLKGMDLVRIVPGSYKCDFVLLRLNNNALLIVRRSMLGKKLSNIFGLILVCFAMITHDL